MKRNGYMMKTKHMMLTSLAALAIFQGCASDDDEGGLGTNSSGLCANGNGTDISRFSGDVNAFLNASNQLVAVSASIDADLLEACNNISSDLGGATATDVATACNNAVTQINAIKQTQATATLAVQFVPARCEVNVEAYASCAAQCDVNANLEATPVTCEGGQLVGSCSGSCSGECSVSAQADCTATCTGSCTGECSAQMEGSCTGTCTGRCDGTCSATNEQGQCEGECNGTCSGMCSGNIEGSCTGSCTGSCSGECTAAVEGSCSGQCQGSCDVAWEPIRCEGGEVTAEVDAECNASCSSDASFEAECTEPEVVVTFDGTVDSDFEPLFETLDANMPTIFGLGARLGLAAEAAADFGNTFVNASASFADASLEALACVGAASAAALDVSASLSVSVQASASVSGSVVGDAG